jgi:hypothetical protein
MKLWQKMAVKFFLVYDAVLNHNKLQVISYQMSYRTPKIHVWNYNYNAKQKTAESFLNLLK